MEVTSGADAERWEGLCPRKVLRAARHEKDQEQACEEVASHLLSGALCAVPPSRESPWLQGLASLCRLLLPSWKNTS